MARSDTANLGEAGQLEAGVDHTDGGQPARVSPSLQKEDADLMVPGGRGRVSLKERRMKAQVECRTGVMERAAHTRY